MGQLSLSFLIYPLILTLAAECIIAFILGVRGVRQFIVIILMNLITNPLINTVLRLVYDKLDLNRVMLYILILILELAVVLSEGFLLAILAGRLPLKPMRFSFVLNLSSFIAGLIVSVLIWCFRKVLSGS